LRAVGHIRAFATMAALAASAALAMVLIIEPVTWFVLRVLSGVCIASLFANVESWLNASVSNDNRAKTLSIYRFVDLFSVTASQYLIPILGVGGFASFAVTTILLMLSLVPVSLADKSNPAKPADFSFSLRTIWNVSPLACIGCITVGLTNSSFRSIGPLYAEGIGLTVEQIATFMSAGIIGGVVLQYPLGMISDRIDRRIVLIIATGGATLAGIFLVGVAGRDPLLNLAGIFFFGAFSMPLYSLSCAHANDHVKIGDFVQIASGLLFFWSLGAVIGPLIAAMLIQSLGPQTLFSFTSFFHGTFVLYTLVRMRKREAISPETGKGRFAALLRTSPFFARMATRAANRPQPRDEGRDKGVHIG
jgi:MFS family permease